MISDGLAHGQTAQVKILCGYKVGASCWRVIVSGVSDLTTFRPAPDSVQHRASFERQERQQKIKVQLLRPQQEHPGLPAVRKVKCQILKEISVSPCVVSLFTAR
jgi:hypothetical protein